MFHIGQKVVCIGGMSADERKAGRYGHGTETVPQKGSVYTIRCIVAFGNTTMLYLSEIVNQPKAYRFPDGIDRVTEPPFEAKYFRPVKTTSIEIFRAMLVASERMTQP